MSEKRIAFREHRGDMIAKYKTMLIKRIWDKIDKIPTDKLSKLATKIDKLQSKYEKNTRMNEEQKNKILSMIEWLRDVINEKINIAHVDVDDAMNVVDEVLK
jgi:signal transduction histidine kinase